MLKNGPRLSPGSGSSNCGHGGSTGSTQAQGIGFAAERAQHQGRTPMSQHHIVSCRPEHCHWGFFDAALNPVVTVTSGDTVQVDCVSGGPDILPKGDHWEILG